jgi:hypothetical protein
VPRCYRVWVEIGLNELAVFRPDSGCVQRLVGAVINELFSENVDAEVLPLAPRFGTALPAPVDLVPPTRREQSADSCPQKRKRGSENSFALVARAHNRGFGAIVVNGDPGAETDACPDTGSNQGVPAPVTVTSYCNAPDVVA